MKKHGQDKEVPLGAATAGDSAEVMSGQPVNHGDQNPQQTDVYIELVTRDTEVSVLRRRLDDTERQAMSRVIDYATRHVEDYLYA